ncbi:hypothetical protein EYF80_063022 [Liparis tanakae]|uniref:Uncharacterized protein n=1 Tax=Liparis tanakae TaxID=230148 RepID=A0A4Z2EDL6_9TELE|nr:hypothetical protein EYF80_063022 [Liparis tanakae]
MRRSSGPWPLREDPSPEAPQGRSSSCRQQGVEDSGMVDQDQRQNQDQNQDQDQRQNQDQN